MTSVKSEVGSRVTFYSAANFTGTNKTIEMPESGTCVPFEQQVASAYLSNGLLCELYQYVASRFNGDPNSTDDC